MKNINKDINNPILSTNNPSSKDWRVFFYYRNSENKRKKYSIIDNLNKKPFVVDGVAVTTKRVYDNRIKLANQLIEALTDDLATINFNVDVGVFDPNPLEQPFLSYIDRYIKSKVGKKDNTIDQYKSCKNRIEKYLNEHYNVDYPLNKIDRNWIDQFLLNVIDETSLGNRDYYLNFINFVYLFISNKLDVTVKNPCKSFEKKLNKGQTEKHKAIYSADILESFKLLEDYDLYLSLLAKFVFYTLHRFNTILGIQHEDIDWNRGTIHLPSKNVKTYRKQTIHLPKSLLNQLKELTKGMEIKPNDYLLGHEELIPSSRGRLKTDVKIFGSKPTKSDVFKAMYLLFRKNRVKNDCDIFTNNHTLYGYKHSGIVYLRDSDFNDQEIIERTGHANPSILATYSKDYVAKIKEFPEL